MSRLILAFAAGALLGAALMVIVLPDGSRARRRAHDSVWRERAEQASVELAAAQRQRDTLAQELQRLTERFQTLAERFDALSRAMPSPAPPDAPE